MRNHLFWSLTLTYSKRALTIGIHDDILQPLQATPLPFHQVAKLPVAWQNVDMNPLKETTLPPCHTNIDDCQCLIFFLHWQSNLQNNQVEMFLPNAFIFLPIGSHRHVWILIWMVYGLYNIHIQSIYSIIFLWLYIWWMYNTVCGLYLYTPFFTFKACPASVIIYVQLTGASMQCHGVELAQTHSASIGVLFVLKELVFQPSCFLNGSVKPSCRKTRVKNRTVWC